MTGFLSTTELDFTQLKNNLKTYMKGQSTLSDHDFEGSNISVLLELLSYNTYLNSHYLNMVASEMFLDTATIRESVISHAKELNYVPRSKTSSRVTARVTITPEVSVSTVTIPKFYSIKTVIDNVTYKFMTDQSYNLKAADNFISEEITFYEGELVEERFTAQVTTYPEGRVDSYIHKIQSENADISSIEVLVQDSVGILRTTPFYRANDMYGVTSDSNVFFVEGFGANQYQIVFGNNIIGKGLVTGNVVIIRYRDTVGDLANGARNFTKTTSIDNGSNTYNNISVAITSPSYGGAERESIDDIKYFAPRYYQTQGRAVTTEDYKTLVKQKFPQLQAVAAYGGEEVEPRQYGKMIISVKPYNTYGLITNTLKRQIIKELTGKNQTTEPVIVDPEYFYVNINSVTQYDPKSTLKTPSTLESEITERLVALNLSTFNDFGKDLRYSKITKVIDDDDSLVSNDTEIKMVKRINPIVGVINKDTINFDNALKTDGVLHVKPLNSESTISSSVFDYEIAGVIYKVYLQDNGAGSLLLYTISTNNTKVVVADNVGTVDYLTGVVKFNMIFGGYQNYINIYATTENKDIIVKKNKFLIIADEDINISVVEEIS